MLLTAQVRAAEQNTSVNLVEVAEYTVYRQTVLFFAITDLIIREMFTGIQENQGQVSSDPCTETVYLPAYIAGQYTYNCWILGRPKGVGA